LRKIGEILDVDHSLVHRWVNEADENLQESSKYNDISEVNFGQMWQFIESSDIYFRKH